MYGLQILYSISANITKYNFVIVLQQKKYLIRSVLRIAETKVSRLVTLYILQWLQKIMGTSNQDCFSITVLMFNRRIIAKRIRFAIGIRLKGSMPSPLGVHRSDLRSHMTPELRIDLLFTCAGSTQLYALQQAL